MGAGHLNPARFEALLDANPGLAEVELSNYGEMFLNPGLTEILRAAYSRQVVLHADNGVNLNHAPDEVLAALVQYRMRSLTVSIDGASQESYSRYRVRGEFEMVLGNIRKLNEYKRQQQTVFPMVCWQFIVFGHNEDELAAARKMAAELGMSFRPKISWDDDVSPVRNRDLVRIQTGLPGTRQEHYQATGTAYLRDICHQLWQSPVLNWDGRVMGCCRNYWGDFGGNAFDDGLEAALRSPGLEHARRMLMGQAEAMPEVPCTTCDLYQTMRQDGSWIGKRELVAGAGSVILGIVIDEGRTEATHCDVFVSPGGVDRLKLASPPAAQRYRIGDQQRIAVAIPAGVEHTVYALPKRLDPSYRKRYPALPAVTVTVTAEARPGLKDVVVRLGG